MLESTQLSRAGSSTDEWANVAPFLPEPVPAFHRIPSTRAILAIVERQRRKPPARSVTCSRSPFRLTSLRTTPTTSRAASCWASPAPRAWRIRAGRLASGKRTGSAWTPRHRPRPMRTDVERSLLAAAGVPVELVSAAQGTAGKRGAGSCTGHGAARDARLGRASTARLRWRSGV